MRFGIYIERFVSVFLVRIGQLPYHVPFGYMLMFEGSCPVFNITLAFDYHVVLEGPMENN